MMTLTIPSGKDEVLIGRGDAADVRIVGKTASRVHARLRQVGGGWLVEDAGSRTGTFLNGARLTAMTAVTAEDELTMGGETYRLDLPAIAVAAPVEPVEKTPAEPTGPVVPPPKAVRQMELYVPDGGEVTISDPAVIKAMQAIQRRILEKLNVAEGAVIGSGKETTARAVQFLDETLHELEYMIPEGVETAAVRQQLVDDLIGFGPISPLIRDHRISEIMINGPENVFVEHKGKLKRTPIRFADEEHLQLIIQRIVEPLGRHVDTASPMVDARLPDGSRVNAVIPPLALDGSLVTIRKFSDKKLTDDDLVKFGSLTRPMALFLREAVRARQNIIVSGGTGSGKTTLLNILSQFIPADERVVTVEDSAELKLDHENLCRLESRPANVEGTGRITIRDLVINTLRMRPDRIVVGECRGAEALDMLQAMNTGHDGSLTTLHANSPRDALGRLENMVMMAGFDLPSSAIREQVASAVDLIVQQTRLPDGSRKIVRISEITGREGDVIQMQDIFTFEQEGFDEHFHVIGHHTATGNIPLFIENLRQAGDLQLDMSVFVPGES